MAKYASLVLIVLLTFVCSRGAHAHNNNDFQIWQETGFEWNSNPEWRVYGRNEMRMWNNSTDFYNNNLEVDLFKKFSDYIFLGTGFRYTYAKPQSKGGSWGSEYWPIMTALVELGSEKVSLSSRNRFEYRAKQNGRDHWMYRNRVQIGLKLESSKPEIVPYLADEFFIDINNGDFNENRIYAGINISAVKHLKVGPYYMRQYYEIVNWKANNVMGLKLTGVF